MSSSEERSGVSARAAAEHRRDPLADRLRVGRPGPRTSARTRSGMPRPVRSGQPRITNGRRRPKACAARGRVSWHVDDATSNSSAAPANDAPHRLIDDVAFGEDVVVHSFTNLYGCADRRRDPDRDLRRDPARRRDRRRLQDPEPHLHLRRGPDRGRGLRRPRRHLRQRQAPAGDRRRRRRCRPRPTGSCWRPWSSAAPAIGSGATILGGVRIGAGATVGAGAVVIERRRRRARPWSATRRGRCRRGSPAQRQRCE